MVLEEMSTALLIEAYERAKELELDDDFINILEKTLKDRLYTPVTL